MIKIKFYPYSCCKKLKFLYFSMILLFITSCISIRYNYIGGLRTKGVNNQMTIDYLPYYENQRKQISHQADSLIQAISLKNEKRNFISANDLNLLYETFGAQLNNDRYFNSLLKKGNFRRDSLSTIQRYAASRLLFSANEYNTLYQDNQVIRRALNRGDMGNNIPRNILRKSQYFLNSPRIRRVLSRGRVNSAFDTDSIMQHLPKTSFFKSIYNHIYQRNDRINSIKYFCFHFIGKSFFARKSATAKEISSHKKNATQLLSELQPYDIILEKSNDYMANQVIPGYFTHASLWLGIKNLHKYKYTPIKLFKGQNRRCTINDRAMEEAITSGVRLSSLKEFTHGKIFMVIRFFPLAEEQKKQCYPMR
jgi:hypothetical protein